MTRPRPARATFRRYLLQGLAVIGPLGITAFVLVWLFQRADGLLRPLFEPMLGRTAPGVGVVLLIVLLVLVGWVVEKTLGRRLVHLGERWLSRVPLVRRVYRGSSRIVRAGVGEEKMAFREVVLFEYPRAGLWTYGLVTGRAPSSAEAVLQDEGVTIYMPTAPNPMSGYLIVANRSDVRITDLTPEEVFTYVLSAGSVTPGRAAELLEGDPASTVSTPAGSGEGP